MAALSMHSPVGDLTLFEDEDAIVALEWGWSSLQVPSPLLSRAKAVLDAYFDGTAPLAHDLPLNPKGTAYQRRVWSALCAIPHGQTRSYAEIAAKAGGSPRSVGGANAANPIPLLIPCHRVCAASGLGGYSGGDGLETKKWLLALEERTKGKLA